MKDTARQPVALHHFLHSWRQMLIAFLFSVLTAGSGPTDGWPSVLASYQRGMHARALGYLDLLQVQDLDPDAPASHPTAGELQGFRQDRRVAGILMGPDSAALVRYGLEGSWQDGGWTPDLYFTSAPDPHLSRRSWSFGLCAAWVPQEVFFVGGIHHSGAAQWSDATRSRVLDPETDAWGNIRWSRGATLGAFDRRGAALIRASLLPNPEPLPKTGGSWFFRLAEGSMWWARSDWNDWSKRDAYNASLRLPFLKDRVGGRVEGGTDGFHFAQVTSDVDPQGEVGLDGSLADHHGKWLPGFRLRVPLLTFSFNDPDDVGEFGSRSNLVWSIRLKMVWEDATNWYAPGRRGTSPSAAGIDP